jgi:hypothetical protein
MPELTERRRNWAPWLGLLLAVAAMLSNAGFFLGLPGERAIPWLSLALAIAALVCAVIGAMRAFRQSNVYGGKASSSILGVVVLLIGAATVFGHVSARALPAAAGAPQVGQKAPDFTLADTNGNKVSLGQLLGKDRISLTATPREALERLGMAKGLPPIAAGAAVAPKAVLLIFYRGYW